MSYSSRGNFPVNNNLASFNSVTTSSQGVINVYESRDPTPYDVNYSIQKRWINTTLLKEWILKNYYVDNATGALLSNWVLLSTGGGQPLFEINVDASTPPGTDPVVPSVSGVITMTGAQVPSGTTANVIRTDSLAANTLTIKVQRSTTSATPNVDLNGVCHFDSADFSVDSDGFVSFNGTGLVTWQTISANQTLATNNGYICVAPGGALSLALPATAAIGDIIEVTLDGATSWTITQAASQQIRYGNIQTTLGAGGSLASTGQGNTIRMVAQSATKWNVISALGALTVT